MKTSNFAHWKNQKFPGAISISRYPDRRSGFNGPEFPPLMPSAGLLKAYKDKKIDWEVYRGLYFDQLSCLSPMKVAYQLEGLAEDWGGDGAEPVLLCYESSKTLDTNPCHRRLVAEWFKSTVGLKVPEFEA